MSSSYEAYSTSIMNKTKLSFLYKIVLSLFHLVKYTENPIYYSELKLERHLHAWWHAHAAGELAHLLFIHFFDTADGVVNGGGD